MQIKFTQCPITGAVQLKLDKPFDKTSPAHTRFKKMIKDHAFEWDYDTRTWEGSIEAVEDILEDNKNLAIVTVFIKSSEPQGLSFLNADKTDMEQDAWIERVKSFDINAVACELKSIPKATFQEHEAASSQEATPVKRKWEGPPRAGKKPA